MTMRRFLLITSLALVLSACEVRTHLRVDANDLSNGTITAVVGFDEEFRNLMAESGGQGDILAELESSAEAEGWEAEPFVDGDIEGYQISRGFSSIEELQELMSSSMLSEEWGYTDISFTEDEGDFVFEASGGNPMSELSGEAGFEGMEDLLTIDFQIAVTFPGPVQEHNGDLEARTVTWDLDNLETGTGTLFGRSSVGGGFPWAIIGGVVLALLVAGAVVWRLRESKPKPTEIVVPVVVGPTAGENHMAGEIQPASEDQPVKEST
ncbi:MAG: hypothetical protein H0T94_05610 [Acidimicrobiia bacterium]|nr:hypothetical protein [Acidimicrobiia bacterium]MDQ3500377.1 hypothetical protein [Actinomycetota bacterium]